MVIAKLQNIYEIISNAQKINHIYVKKEFVFTIKNYVINLIMDALIMHLKNVLMVLV
jgi:hypothetical protein